MIPAPAVAPVWIELHAATDEEDVLRIEHGY